MKGNNILKHFIAFILIFSLAFNIVGWVRLMDKEVVHLICKNDSQKENNGKKSSSQTNNLEEEIDDHVKKFHYSENLKEKKSFSLKERKLFNQKNSKDLDIYLPVFLPPPNFIV